MYLLFGAIFFKLSLDRKWHLYIMFYATIFNLHFNKNTLNLESLELPDSTATHRPIRQATKWVPQLEWY